MKQSEIWDALYKHLTWKKESASLPNILRGKKVLELGVGTGKTLLAIKRQKPSLIQALDFSSKAIERSKKLFKNNVKFRLADATKMPFLDESFDVVVAYYILNNSLKKDRTKIMKEIYRVLKKQGICIFEEFSTEDFRNIGKKHKTDKNTIVKKNGLICHFFDDEEVKDLFSDFSKVKMKIVVNKPIRSNIAIERRRINVIATKNAPDRI